ncbi:MAG: hypothetical protein K1X89_00280 [Myxococcaceae bacterium]|nr:hypothetical protein [Myxococcaceae bacterium]
MSFALTLLLAATHVSNLFPPERDGSAGELAEKWQKTCAGKPTPACVDARKAAVSQLLAEVAVLQRQGELPPETGAALFAIDDPFCKAKGLELLSLAPKPNAKPFLDALESPYAVVRQAVKQYADRVGDGQLNRLLERWQDQGPVLEGWVADSAPTEAELGAPAPAKATYRFFASGPPNVSVFTSKQSAAELTAALAKGHTLAQGKLDEAAMQKQAEAGQAKIQELIKKGDMAGAQKLGMELANAMQAQVGDGAGLDQGALDHDAKDTKVIILTKTAAGTPGKVVLVFTDGILGTVAQFMNLDLKPPAMDPMATKDPAKYGKMMQIMAKPPLDPLQVKLPAQ